jgi:hypothetical protein
MSKLLQSPFSVVSFYFILSVITLYYALYYANLYKQVINKDRFFAAVLPQTSLLCLVLAICAALINFSIAPFGGIYIYTLVYYRTIHMNALDSLNMTGAL